MLLPVKKITLFLIPTLCRFNPGAALEAGDRSGAGLGSTSRRRWFELATWLNSRVTEGVRELDALGQPAMSF